MDPEGNSPEELRPGHAEAVRGAREVAAGLEGVTEPERAVAFRRALWLRLARAEQVRDPEPDIYALIGGRGSGKTRPGAEETYWNALQNPGTIWAAVSPTIGACRNVQFLGESGLKAVIPEPALYGGSWDKAFNGTRMEVQLANRSRIVGFGSVNPDRLRGPNFAGWWIDEPASFADAHRLPFDIGTTFSNLVMATRTRIRGGVKGILTGTPKRCPLMTGDSGLNEPGILTGLEVPSVKVVRMSTRDNLDNLDPVLAKIVMSLDGTRIGRQEIDAEILTEVEGSKFKDYWAVVDSDGLLPQKRFIQIVIGVDPSGGTDRTGIVVCGIDLDHVYWTLEDLTDHHPTSGTWAFQVWDAVRRWGPQSLASVKIAAERNFGGAMVRETLESAENRIAGVEVITPWAAHGKGARFDPVALLFEPTATRPIGARARFAQPMPLLVNEMTSWTEKVTWSPNAMDAMTWAMLHLTEHDPAPVSTGEGRVSLAQLRGARSSVSYN